MLEAEAFACGCHHVKYEKSFIDFCVEGNIYENSRRYSLRYFLNIDHPEPLTTQCLSQLTVSREITSMMQPSEHVAFLNPVCKPLMNGAKCANCENYPGAFKESFYVPLCPRTNEDERRKQICLRVNVCPINDLRLRKVDLCKVKNSKDLRHYRRKSYGVCGANCNLRHNLHSTMGTLTMNLRSRVGEPVHWPHQNYEIDHIENVSGRVCGCDEEWNSDMKLHNIITCAWMKNTGDVINGNYDMHTNTGLNVVKSYCDLAIKRTCRCVPSWSLLKHGQLRGRLTTIFGHDMRTSCEFGGSNCKCYCSSCAHYCGLSHEL